MHLVDEVDGGSGQSFTVVFLHELIWSLSVGGGARSKEMETAPFDGH